MLNSLRLSTYLIVVFFWESLSRCTIVLRAILDLFTFVINEKTDWTCFWCKGYLMTFKLTSDIYYFILVI